MHLGRSIDHDNQQPRPPRPACLSVFRRVRFEVFRASVHPVSLQRIQEWLDGEGHVLDSLYFFAFGGTTCREVG